MIEIRTSEEVFTTAIAMEEIAQAFYEALGLGSSDAKVRQFCLLAAAAELGHADTFRGLQQEWAGSRRLGRLAEELVEPLRSTVKASVLPTCEEVQEVALRGDLKAAVDLAVQLEKDSIRFYQGLLSRLPDLAAALEPILAEENRHLSYLLTFGRPV